MQTLKYALLLPVLAACGFPRPPDLAPVDGGSGDQDAAGGLLPPALELLAGDIGGPGDADDTGAAARFFLPGGVALDNTGNLYVADHDNHTIRKVTPAGVVTTLAGAAGMRGTADGTGAAARFTAPEGVAVDSAGNLYIADNHTVRKVTSAGVVTTLAGTADVHGSADGTGANARFTFPKGVAVDSAGNVYVTDDSSTIRKVTTAGVVTTLAGTADMFGSADGTGATARFSDPRGVAVDGVGNLYVADTSNDTVRKVTPAGVVTTLAGAAGMVGSADGTGPTARFSGPQGVAVDSAGNVYVMDTGNNTLRKVTPAAVVTTLAGAAGMAGSADGGTAARFNTPSGTAVDTAGNVYVTDTGNDTLRKVTPAGVVTTFAGAAGVSGSADDIGSAARFASPGGVAADSAGNVYVADSLNSTIRKVTAAGVVTTLAGAAGMLADTDGTGVGARFFRPFDVAVDSASNLYVADTQNGAIRVVTPAGAVTTLAGGAAAGFFDPQGVAVDSVGNVYVADTENVTIRKVTPAGVVTTLAGAMGMQGSADGGAAARFSLPRSVAVDNVGNVYVADPPNNNIRKITPAGIVTTLAGAAGMAGSADGPGATARFFDPAGIAVDNAGNLYVTDTGNSTIRKITPTGVTTTIAGDTGVSGIVLGSSPRFASPGGLAIVGDALVICDTNAILLLRHVVN